MNLVGDILKNAAAFATATEKTTATAAGSMMDSAKNGKGDESPKVLISDDMRQDAMRVVQEWAETDDLDDGEGLGDRLLALIVGTATVSDQDLTEDESEYAGHVAELVGDYLEEKGVAPADVDALIGDFSFDNDVAERVHEVLLDKLPQGEEAMLDDAGRFVDGDESMMLDATYRKVLAVRDGKKVRINKRIAGTVRLSGKQKAAIRKMQRKAFSGAAKLKRAKSMRLRIKLGL